MGEDGGPEVDFRQAFLSLFDGLHKVSPVWFPVKGGNWGGVTLVLPDVDLSFKRRAEPFTSWPCRTTSNSWRVHETYVPSSPRFRCTTSAAPVCGCFWCTASAAIAC